jgi:hypothetical protein
MCLFLVAMYSSVVPNSDFYSYYLCAHAGRAGQTWGSADLGQVLLVAGSGQTWSAIYQNPRGPRAKRATGLGQTCPYLSGARPLPMVGHPRHTPFLEPGLPTFTHLVLPLTRYGGANQLRQDEAVGPRTLVSVQHAPFLRGDIPQTFLAAVSMHIDT